jgi:hypothetical protein
MRNSALASKRHEKEDKMKTLLLIALTAIPLFAFQANFVYNNYDYDDYGDGYWHDEYWNHGHYYCHDHYVYYPYGHYCVYYVWYHPWWWDWYWWHCYWCHHWDWHFFHAGYYVVYYDAGCWWWRPRYGRVVRYKLPYSYTEFRYKAREYGHYLPDKPPREISIPYNEKEVLRLTKEKDPELYSRLEKEQKSGNLEKMRKDYETTVNKEITVKNEEYRKTKTVTVTDDKTVPGSNKGRTDDQRNFTKPSDDEGSTRGGSRIIRKSRDESDSDEKYDNGYIKPGSDDRDEKDERSPQRNRIIDRSSDEDNTNEKYNSSTRTPIKNLPPPDDNKKDDKPSSFSNSKNRR